MMQQQTLRDCIAWAYGLNAAGQITGPEWLDSEKYDIEATTGHPEKIGPDELESLLQSLRPTAFG